MEDEKVTGKEDGKKAVISRWEDNRERKIWKGNREGRRYWEVEHQGRHCTVCTVRKWEIK
jgi:hypothetical protein